MRFLRSILLLLLFCSPALAAPTSVAELTKGEDFKAAAALAAKISEVSGVPLPMATENRTKAFAREDFKNLFVLSAGKVYTTGLEHCIVFSGETVFSEDVKNCLIVAVGDVKVRYHVRDSVILTWGRVVIGGSAHRNVVQAKQVKIRELSADSKYVNAIPGKGTRMKR